MCDLAGRLQLSPSGLTRRLDGLVRAGLVERRALRQRSSRDARGARRRRAARARGVGADPRRQRAPAGSSTCSTDDELRGGRRACSSKIRDGARSEAAAGDHRLPRGFGCPRRQHRRQGRHRRLRRDRRRPAGAGRRRVHAQPVRRSERDDQPRSTSPTAGRGRWSSCRRTPTSPTARSGSTTPTSWSTRRRRRLGCEPADVLVASTGVIGRRYPIERIRDGVAAMPRSRRGGPPTTPRRGIMTTDTVAKVATRHGRRRAGAGRRHRQGRRDDRARHGDDDRRAADRRRCSTPDAARPPVPRGRRCARSTASASTPTRRPATRP